MKTAVETDREGTTKLRVYHRAGSTPQGPNTRFAWTHPYSERKKCTACTNDTIPADVKDGTRLTQ